MASKRGLRRRATKVCREKRRFPDREAALEALNDMLTNPRKAVDPAVTPYLGHRYGDARRPGYDARTHQHSVTNRRRMMNDYGE